MIEVSKPLYDEKLVEQALSQEAAPQPPHRGRYTILEHMNIFNKIVSDLPCLEVKLEEEDKHHYFLLLKLEEEDKHYYFLLLSHCHMTT